MKVTDAPERVTGITKLEAAKRQIETAIGLWFAEEDVISIHTLTGAAHRIVLDLLKHKGETLVPFDNRYLERGKEKELKRMFRAAETFFKHAHDDPDKTHDFNPGWTEVYLSIAIGGYFSLVHSPNALMTTYMLRCSLRWPQIFPTKVQELTKSHFDVEALKQLSRKKFFREVYPHLRE